MLQMKADKFTSVAHRIANMLKAAGVPVKAVTDGDMDVDPGIELWEDKTGEYSIQVGIDGVLELSRFHGDALYPLFSTRNSKKLVEETKKMYDKSKTASDKKGGNMDKIASELVKVARLLVSDDYSKEIIAAMDNLLDQIRVKLDQKFVEALYDATKGDYTLAKQIQYKIVTMIQDAAADAATAAGGYEVKESQFNRQHRGYASPKYTTRLKDEALLWFKELNDARMFTLGRIALIDYAFKQYDYKLDRSKLTK